MNRMNEMLTNGKGYIWAYNYDFFENRQKGTCKKKIWKLTYTEYLYEKCRKKQLKTFQKFLNTLFRLHKK